MIQYINQDNLCGNIPFLFANQRARRLDLEAHALSPSSGLLLLSVLGAYSGSHMGSRLSGDTEVFVGGSALARSPQEYSVGAKWGAKSKLIEGETFTTSLYNASTSILCEPQRTDGQLRELQEPGIIGDGTDNNGDLAFPLSLSVAYKLGQGQRRSVNPAHAQSFQNYAVERRTSPACQESVKLK